MFSFDNDLKALVESPVAVVVGTTNAEKRPHAIYAWGPRVLEDMRSMQVFIEVPRASEVLQNLEATGVIAVTIADPITYRSLQFKGRFRSAAPAEEADLACVQRHREGFASVLSVIGDPRQVIENAWMQCGLIRIEFEIDRAYDQTPGPEAGRPL
ncbi:MAG TPA: pyridoxamine 5'-phosphate oxidase family protein [Gemmatimonadales bacterium]|nr:pyridoxamine 5'-phosphate oxidase family protein [Gemmatimonadales bacterium]